MKTIEINDETYNFLMDLSKEINNQNHRGTAMPYFFQVQTKHQIAVPEGNGNIAWHYDGNLIETKEEIIQAIYDYRDGDLTKKAIKEMSNWERESEMERAGYSKVNYDFEERLENSFLTEKACLQHIKDNKHNLSQPQDYLSYASRNPEMEKLLIFICGLTGGGLHK
jgi:hypothetical protein